MRYSKIFLYAPLTFDVIGSYEQERRKGSSREAAIKTLVDCFKEELMDEEDHSAIQIGIAIALCRKNELTVPVQREAICAIDAIIASGGWGKDGDRLLLELKQHLESGSCLGVSAHYSRERIYIPDWRLGDTFIHRFSQPASLKMGLGGQFIVLRKVGGYLDQDGHHMQLVYCTVCSADTIPGTSAELRELGFLRMMKHGKKFDYLGQLYFKSKKDEERWGLDKIGRFPDAGAPDDASIEDPRVSMPLFGMLRHQDSSTLHYEELVCQLIRSCGINRPSHSGS